MYITNKDTIIFDPNYNDSLDINLISQYKKIIFTNWRLIDHCNLSYEEYVNCKYDYLVEWHSSIFNQEVSQWPDFITHIAFGCDFNQKVEKLPQQLTQLIFGSHFNQEVTKLSQQLTHLTFGHDFNQEITKLPNYPNS